MKKWWIALALALLLAATACGGGGSEKTTLRVGATQVPHAEILNHIKPTLEKEGIQLEVRVFQDYVLPNKAVEEEELDANYFQHIPWMKSTNKEQGWHLVQVAGVHIEPMGAYSKKYKSKEEIPEGATIALPNATSEMTRVLLLLDQQGLIKLDNREGDKTLKHIQSNPKKLRFKALEPAILPRVLDQVDASVINTNYALQAKLNPLKDSLFIEDKDSPFVNVLAVKEGNEKDPAIQKLAKVLTSPEVKKFIEEKYNGAIVPAF